MTVLEKKIFVALTVLVALSRLLAVAQSMFDWDEGLFANAIREYNVVNHHPHPPGYPLFIAAAKVVHAMGIDEFRALQTVVVIAAMLLFPALFLLAREIGFPFGTAAGAAVLFCFLPNVWVYGGTGFSDIPALTIALFACWLLLRGRREPHAYVLGAIVLGIAAGIRPPSLIIGALPALLGTYHRIRARDFGRVVAAATIGAAIVVGCYAGAAYATGSVSSYLKAVEAQSKYVRDVDSWRNPDREPLHEVAEDFFLRPVKQQIQMYGLILLALISIVSAVIKWRRPPLFTFALFAPFAVLAWLTLDVHTTGRYSVSYMAAYAILAVDGIAIIARHRVRVHAVLVAMVVVVFVVWTWPALRLQRTSASPPVAALQWIERNVPRDTPVYIYSGIGPLADHILPERNMFWDTAEQISAMSDAWVLDLRVTTNGHNFLWPRSNPLWKIVRPRNFEVSVSRVSSFIKFGAEWYGEEGSGLSMFRWMPAAATVTLPPVAGAGLLHMRLYVPIDSLPAPPMIEVSVNGAVVERFEGNQAVVEKRWTVPSRATEPNELRITTSAVANPARLGNSDDTRDLGLRVDALSWTPAK